MRTNQSEAEDCYQKIACGEEEVALSWMLVFQAFTMSTFELLALKSLARLILQLQNAKY